MEILQYTTDILTSVTEFYNHLIADVPHCYPVKEQELAAVLSGDTGQSDDVHEELHSQVVFVAKKNGTIQAFIHAAMYEDENENNEKENIGIIRFLGYKRGERLAGQTMLEKAETYFKANNVANILAFSKIYKYRFYHFEYAHLSNTLDHIEALLGLNGYKRGYGQVFLDWENFSVTPTPTNLPVTVAVEWREGRGKLPNCNITAHKDGEEVAVCWSVSCGEFSTHPDVQDWVYTDWLEVEDDFQGQGLGKYLLQYSLHEMHKVGYRHAALSTNCDNQLALLFYSNFGYKVVDWTYGFEKDLFEGTM